MSRETDAKVAEALGWCNILRSPLTGTPGERVCGEWLAQAHGIAALEATGEPYSIDRERHPEAGRDMDYIVRLGATADHCGRGEGPTLPAAAPAAILAWAAEKGTRKKKATKSPPTPQDHDPVVEQDIL